MTDHHQSWTALSGDKISPSKEARYIFWHYMIIQTVNILKSKTSVAGKKWLIIIHNIIRLDNYRCTSLNEMQNPCMLSIVSGILLGKSFLMLHPWRFQNNCCHYFVCVWIHCVCNFVYRRKKIVYFIMNMLYCFKTGEDTDAWVLLMCSL